MLLISLGLAGCVPTAPKDLSGSTPLGTVTTIEDLRDAFVDAGGVCNWKQDDGVIGTTASGTCSEQTVLMLFAEPSAKTEVVARLGSMSIAGVKLHLLVGENWIINSPEAMEMQEALGGRIVTGNS